MSRETAYDLAHVLRELQRLQAAGKLGPGCSVYIEVREPDRRRPVFAATVEAGKLNEPGPERASRPAAPRRTYDLDAVEKMILVTLGRAYPSPLKLEDIAAKLKRSVSTLTYKGRIRRLQEECGLIANDKDHEGYWLTEEGERVAGDLLSEEDKPG